MKSHTPFTTLATSIATTLATSTASIVTLAALVASLTLGSCGGTNSGGNLPALDLASAIDTSRPFDLGEISDHIELIPLDDTRREGLVGNISNVMESKGFFWVLDNSQDVIVKVFDRSGKFLTTVGRYGRGPGEFTGRVSMVPDYDRDLIYFAGRINRRQAAAFDIEGRRLALADSIGGDEMAFHDGRLVVRRSSPRSLSIGNDPDFVTSVGTRVPLLDIYSPDLLEKLETVETVDKGTGSIMNLQTDEAGAILSISVFMGSIDIMTDAGDRLVVKEALSDTVMHYRGGVLEPAYTLPMGKYATPPEAFGVQSAPPSGNTYLVKSVMESDRWVLVDTRPMIASSLPRAFTIFDRRNPGAGFSATGGEDRSPGLFFDGLPVTPVYIRHGRLVGYIPALRIYDNAGRITHPALKAISESIREESNPVLVVATLKD